MRRYDFLRNMALVEKIRSIVNLYRHKTINHMNDGNTIVYSPLEQGYDFFITDIPSRHLRNEIPVNENSRH